MATMIANCNMTQLGEKRMLIEKRNEAKTKRRKGEKRGISLRGLPGDFTFP
jgi:hypothetical protein